MSQKNRPRGFHSGTAQNDFGDTHDSSSARHRQLAFCELHGVNLVHRFPPRCALSMANPLAALTRLQDAAWDVMGRGSDDPEQADVLTVLDQNDTCNSCADRILTHRTVRRLRERLGLRR